MRLNKKEPYGHIYGNHVATYTQHGKFFDGAGNEIDKEGITKDEELTDEEKLDQAEDFLREMLTETRVAKKTVAKEAEGQGISWEFVAQAAENLGVREIKIKNVLNWTMPDE